MTDVDRDSIPRVTLVFNGPLGMTPGKEDAQAFQVAERLLTRVVPYERLEAVRAWKKHTTTIARVATTTQMFERVCAEVPGVVMVDEGHTEVDPDTATVFASWPELRADEHKLFSNSKVPLIRERGPFDVWPDEWISELAGALESAEGEGAFGDETDQELAAALRTEAARRHLRLRAAYGDRTVAPEQWLTHLA